MTEHELSKRLRTKAGMIELGERIAWGSDSALMREAANLIDQLAANRGRVKTAPTPPPTSERGYQPIGTSGPVQPPPRKP